MTMVPDAGFSWTVRWIRLDAIAIAVVTLWAVAATKGSWGWFVALFLVPDLSMSGYLFGRRAGAIAYNTGHMYMWPVMLLGLGLANHLSFTTTAGLSWVAHIACDQALGYGLKLPTGFEQTVLGPIGRSRINNSPS